MYVDTPLVWGYESLSTSIKSDKGKFKQAKVNTKWIV